MVAKEVPMTASLLRQPVLKAAIAFLEKVWEPMVHLAPLLQPEKEGCPIPVAVEFGLRPVRRRPRSTPTFY